VYVPNKLFANQYQTRFFLLTNGRMLHVDRRMVVGKATTEILYYKSLLYYVSMQRMSVQALEFCRHLSPRIKSSFN